MAPAFDPDAMRAFGRLIGRMVRDVERLFQVGATFF